MLDELNRLELTSKDIELIEAALHTQKKILSVQSKAGGAAARQRLTDIKHLMKRVSRYSQRKITQKPPGWSVFARSLFSPARACERCPSSDQP